MWINPEDYKALGARLEELRKKAGLTQVELAKRLGKPQSFISSYETGQRRLDVLEFEKVLEAIGIDLDEPDEQEAALPLAIRNLQKKGFMVKSVEKMFGKPAAAEKKKTDAKRKLTVEEHLQRHLRGSKKGPPKPHSRPSVRERSK